MIIHRNCIMCMTTAATLLGSALIAMPAHGTPSREFVSTPQWEGRFGDINVNPKTEGFHLKLQTKGDYDVVVTKISIGAATGNGSSGWHTHPGSSLVKVTGGAILLYDAALCTPTRLGIGQTFVDEGGGHLHLVRNEPGAAAEVSVVQFMPRGVARRIDAPRPSNCDPAVQ